MCIAYIKYDGRKNLHILDTVKTERILGHKRLVDSELLFHPEVSFLQILKAEGHKSAQRHTTNRDPTGCAAV